MIMDFVKTVAQLRDRRLIKLFFVSLLAAAVLLGALIAISLWVLTSIEIGDGGLFGLSGLDMAIRWVIDSVAVAAAVLMALMLFPAAAIGLQSLFLDAVADGVEAKHYPHLPPARRQRVSEIVASALRLMMIMLGLNILLLFVWLIMLLIAPPLAPVPFYLVNGYLLGREYFELVALRRMNPLEANVIRRQKLGWNMADGILMTLLFTVPILNLAGPIIAAAYMTHRFHRVWTPGQDGASAIELPSGRTVQS